VSELGDLGLCFFSFGLAFWLGHFFKKIGCIYYISKQLYNYKMAIFFSNFDLLLFIIIIIICIYIYVGYIIVICKV
jgi:hypothetical protein